MSAQHQEDDDYDDDDDEKAEFPGVALRRERAVAPQQYWFAHEKLDVYCESIAFVAWLSRVVDEIERAGDVKDQLDRASTSIPLNIAEGNGKYTPKDRCRFFDNAHGSALECAAGLDILVAKGRLSVDQIQPGKQRLQNVVRMLFGLIKRNSDRDYDGEGPHALESGSSSSSSS